MADLVTRTIKRAYEERKLGNGKGIDELLFGISDEDISAAFRLDRYISTPYGMAYRNADNQSVVRHFKPGTTELIEVPRASEKTPIDEELRDQVAVGVEASAGAMQSLIKNVDQIMGDHLEGHKMTKWKQAIDVVDTGVFPARGVTGGDLGLDYDHGRDAGNSITYDFTAGGATMDEALTNISDVLNGQNAPQGERFCLMGSNWRDAYSTDSTLLERAKANQDNPLLAQQRFSQKYGEVEGLYILGLYRPPGATAPMWILDFTPGTDYIAYEGATATPWVGANDCIFGSFNDKRYNIKRGVDAFDGNSKVVRVVGDMVVDKFSETDPITEFVRSQTRHIYIAGNINHTGKSVGTFA